MRKFFKKIFGLDKRGKTWQFENVNVCISCGAVIPEGMLVCMICEKGASIFRCIICDMPLESDRSICPRCNAIFLQSKKKEQK